MALEPGQTYIELGSGDGRLVAAAAKKGARAIGYEVNPLLWFISWLRILRLKDAHVQLANFWSKDIGSADVVMAFLVPRTMPRLEKKLVKEMKPGSKFVSYVFRLPNRDPALTHKGWFVYNF